MEAIRKNWKFFLLTTALCSIFYATSVESSADTHLGCYDEYGTEAVFVIPSSNIDITSSSLTPDGCRENCRKDEIYSFAGLWGGTRCYCASGLNGERIKEVNNSLCYSPCPGEPTEFCGGSQDSYIYNVYSVCPRGLYGRHCTNKCNCKDNKSCTVHGVCPGNECAAGWQLNSTIPNKERCSIAVDVNDCQPECSPASIISDNCHNCSSALHQECKNTEDSFTCVCAAGYEETNSGTCAEIDECAKGTHNCSHICSNTEGSYKCSCSPGYELQGRFNCKDIDECVANIANCEHTCINTDGSYYCVCQPGYELHYNRHSCVDVDECQTPCSSLKTTKCYQCGQFYECQNTVGSFKCGCKSGFIFDSQQDTCQDVNECSQQLAKCGHTCMNTNGSYECGCLEGFELEDDGHHCVVVESGLWSLVIGLGLGNGLQFIVVVSLAIILFMTLARRDFKSRATVSPTGNEVQGESCAKLIGEAKTPPIYLSNDYAELHNPQQTGSRQHIPNEYAQLDNPQAAGSRSNLNEYDQLDHPKATGPGQNEFCNTVDHQEDPYFEIA